MAESEESVPKAPAGPRLSARDGMFVVVALLAGRALQGRSVAALGAKARCPPGLKKLLVTGNSLAQPLDVTLARRLAFVGG